MGRRFRDMQGRMNQLCASKADRAALIVAGYPLWLKGVWRIIVGNDKNGFQDHLSRFTEEIKSDKFGFDLRDRFVVAWTLFFPGYLCPKKWWPVEMPSGNRTLSLAPLAGGLLGLLTGLVIGISDLLGIGAPGSLWIGVFFYAAVGWSLHLDGWGTVDGVGSGKEGEEMRSVMKEPAGSEPMA